MSASKIFGNWKMHGSTTELQAFAEAWRDVDVPENVTVGLCLPFPYVGLAGQLMPTMAVGAQDCSAQESGAYTGEVSAAMLADVGCGWVTVGHSERRQYHGETDALVAAKAQQAQRNGLTPIVCVGESLAQRESGEHIAVVSEQIKGSLTGVDPSNLVVAYEPVWAIGTGVTATAEQAEAMHREIKQLLVALFGEAGKEISVLYGGSVKPEVAGELFACDNIDGALVGGASLDAASFAGIVAAA